MRSQDLYALARIVTTERSEHPTLQQVAGMSQPEALYSWRGVGMTWYFDESHIHSPVIVSIDALIKGAPLANRLLNATQTVHFSRQSNKDDAYWEQTLGIAGFESAATGGDGGICVYNGRAIDPETLIHELAHNLAIQLYGSPYPLPNSDFAKAAKNETAPTEYAKSNLAEDFAETVMMYFAQTRTSSSQYPWRFSVIGRIMTDDDYTG